MTYSTSNPPFLVAPAVAGGANSTTKGGNIWVYRSTDPISTVTGSRYFTNGATEGMQIGDLVIVIDTATPTVVLANVTSVSVSLGVSVSPSASARGLIGQATHDVDYTLVATDAGSGLYHASASAHSWTIPSGVLPVKCVVVFTTGQSSGTLSILAGAGVTLERVDGTAGTGTRTMAAASKVTAYQRSADVWELSGVFAS